MNKEFIISSESVAEGHPDKLADFISDVILDSILQNDNQAHVACEALIKTGLVLIGGEIDTKTKIDYEEIVRNAIKEIGYNDATLGFDGATCGVITAIGKQSKDIALAVKHKHINEQGAGDQGIMFGYACTDTSELMPAPIFYAHQLMQKQAELRKSGALPWLCPDAKCQITLRYIDNKPIHVESIVFSTQHAENITQNSIYEAVIENIIKPVIPNEWLDKNTKYAINPAGRFVIGGPMSDCGVTGRKIIVDSYGGSAHHGGGSFSGKDPSKVDRSAAYACRYIAKNIVASGLAERCEIQVAYAIGIAEPTAIAVNTFNTGKIPDSKICECIKQIFDLRPHFIIKELNLLRPIYSKTTNYGHFGRSCPEFTWERTDKVDAIQKAAGSI